MPPRSYSVANAPRDDGLLSFLVSKVPGGQGSSWIHERLRVGDHVIVSGPYGTFTAPASAQDEWLFLAGGSGLAPFRAMTEPTLSNGTSRRLTLLLSARSEHDVVDGEHFRRLATQEGRFRFMTKLTGGAGRLPASLSSFYSELSTVEVFSAGPRTFVEACVRAAERLGAQPGHLHAEPF